MTLRPKKLSKSGGGCQFATLMLCLLIASSGVAAEVVTVAGPTMGTQYQIRFVGEPKDAVIRTRVNERLAEIDALMSTYRDDSEISRFARAEAQTWFAVSPETALVVDAAQKISRRTNGAFDITIGPLLRLWSFGPEDSQDQPRSAPSEEQIENVLEIVGFDKLKVRHDPPALWKSISSLEVDLSAIAKGYAVDEISSLLLEAGFADHLVEIGGELRVRGQKPDGSLWNVGLESPRPGARLTEMVVSLSDRAVASSGNYRKYYEADGTHYSHVIDPVLGRPAAHQLSGVAILADDCMSADAYATALFVLGAERGVEWAAANGVEACFLTDAGGEIVTLSTPGFPADASVQAAVADATPSYRGLLSLSAIIFGIAILGMAVGSIVGRRRLTGSCGGLANLKNADGTPSACELCQNDTCENRPSEDLTSEDREVHTAPQ